MNKIYKVMYSKVKQCAVVVSEIAKSHGHYGESSSVRKHAALMAAVLIALGSFSFTTLPTVQATDSLFSNDYVGTNYKDDNGNSYAANVTKNYHGAGAQGVGSNTLGMNAIAGKNTVTIGDRNASLSQESVYIGSKYDANNQVHPSSGTAVVSVGYGSDAAGTGSIAIGSGAAADSFDNAGHGTNPDKSSQSIAIGYNAKAKQNNIAIGAGSMATAAASGTASLYTNQAASKYYVSVGDGTENSATQYRRITNVADGAADSDAATIAQLKKVVSETDASKKANIDASNIGIHLKYKADGKTEADSADKTTNENAWGTAIGTGKVEDKNGQLVTGGTVFNALQGQKNDLTGKLSVTAGWGINIDKENGNTISLKRNLGKNFNQPGQVNWDHVYLDCNETGLVLGTVVTEQHLGSNEYLHYGATGSYALVAGGENNTASATSSSVFGGSRNTASAYDSAIFGGSFNRTVEGAGNAAILGGTSNLAEGSSSMAAGGAYNVAFYHESSVVGGFSNYGLDYWATSVGGFRNYSAGYYSTVIGGRDNIALLGNNTEEGCNVALGGEGSTVIGNYSTGIAGGSTADGATHALAAGPHSLVTVANGTAIGYQATADQTGTISFGHDKGDTYYDGTPNYLTVKEPWSKNRDVRWPQKAYCKYSSKGYVYYDDKNKEISYKEYMSLRNSDGTWNDYYSRPSISQKQYDSAYYNRLVKVADGINDHDVVVMEQLKQYAEKDAGNIGNNLKVEPVYQKDENGNTIYVYKRDKNGSIIWSESHPLIDEEATKKKLADVQNPSKDAWGKALGADVFSKGTTTTATNASTSDQMVTGKTLYDYDKPTGSPNYVSANNTTGQNLSALDAQVKANADTLNDKTHNIKYYSVDENLPKIDGYTNEGNDGAKGMGSIAAGFNTHADGIASTVAGSYSGVLNQDSKGAFDLRGATALSYGTFNVNQNTDSTKAVSGVANSIIGQANVTTDSNAAIIYGAGNTVTNSYRDIDTSKVNLNKVKQDLKNKDVAAVIQDAQKAVPASGGQVMVMGGGNNVESAYMTQVVGVGNTVKGNQVNNDNGEWVTDTSDTAINGYDEDRSSQYNYVDGFNNEVINGKHDYVIGANNKLSGDSYDNDKVRPIKRSNRSNIVIGDNHTLTREQNTVIIGSSDTENTQTKARDAVIIGHNANATNDTGADNAVAIGLSATATGGNAVTIGVNTSAGATSITIGSESSAISGSNIAIGRYAKVYGDKVTNAVALGKLAEAHVADGVAIGSESQATVAGNSVEGYDPGTGEASTDETATWKATKAAVSIGKADGTVTRQINGLAAGTKDTDAVNVAQLKSLQSGLTEDLTGKGLKFAANSGAKYTAELGSTVTIQGTGKKAGHEYTAENLTTEVDGSGNITILMDKNISADKIAVNGKDGKDAVSIAGKDGVGHIGLTGPAGTNGMNGADGKPGTSIDITVKNGYDDTAKGINGTNGVDGKDGITRIVYTDKTGEHQVATLEDGLKFKGDAGTEIAKKLNNTLEIVGGVTDSTKLTDGNIGVVSENGKLNVRLAKDLTGLNSTTYTTKTGEGESETTSTTVVNGNGLTITNGPSITNKGVDGGNKVITNVGSGIEIDANGKYTVTDQNKGNAANVGDVQNMVNDAKKELTDGTNGLNNKANIDASNIGANLKGADGKTASAEKQKTNAENWGSAIGTGEIKDNDGRMVTGKTVYNEVRPKADGNYVKKDKTTGENLSSLDSKIGKLDETKKYNYIDSKSTTSISDNLTKLDTQVKKNADDITNINKSISTLDQNVVKYDDSSKTRVKLGGEGGTTITNVKDGSVTKDSKDAVNGGQLYGEQQARTDADIKLRNDLTTETNERKAADTAINNKIGSLDKDGSYIKKENNVSQNLSALDSGLKATSDLINTNDKRDTIQIGASSMATKIDVKGKDGKGRVITGVVTDDGDPTSAANVGYVNGVTAANTQQIYRDMNNAYGRLNNNINKAAAGSNALAALHPLDYDPDDKADFAVGYGHYRNANAAALGAFYHPNENTMVNVGVSLGNGDPGFNAGVSFKIGSGSAGRQAMSKTEMAKVINSQSKEIDALKKDNADKDKRIDALEQKMAEILAKLDKNGK